MAREEDDFYESPPWVTRLILPYLNPRVWSALDPCAGKGAILKEVQEFYGPQCRTYGIELDRERAEECKQVVTGSCCARDALVQDGLDWYPANLIIMNPPFLFALEFVELATDSIRGCADRQVAVFLKAQFAETLTRNEFLQRRKPEAVYRLPKRPSFVKGKTDSCVYEWWVWGPDVRTTSTKLHFFSFDEVEKAKKGTTK